MKRFILFVSLLTLTATQAQNITDGLRYSSEQINGTARFTSLSGAMGALGGNLSAMGVNPAGSAVFLKPNLTFSTAILDTRNQANYFNTNIESHDSDFTLNQGGGVFVFHNPKEDSAFKKFTLGINYNTTRNYDDYLFIAGIGNTSIADFFLTQAQGIPLNLLELQPGESISDLYRYLGETEGSSAQNAFLGYQGFIIDPADPNNPTNSTYISNVADGNFNQEFSNWSQGYNGKFILNFATQVNDNFFFGVNLNTHSINYDNSTYLYETNNNNGSLVNRIGFENNLSVIGTGFSAQFGGIAKIAQNLRLGLSYDTPTWHTISEATSQYLESRRTIDGQSFTKIVNPHIVNVYRDYNLRTPGKITTSAAYIFGQSGLLSFDYSYKDYSNITYSPTNDTYFSNLNRNIENTLKGVSSFKVGAEYRIQQLSLRGGYNYEESPYKNKETVGDLTGFSLGAGYNFGNFTFDFAYLRSEQDRYEQMYSVGLTDSAKVNTVLDNFTFSLGFNF